MSSIKELHFLFKRKINKVDSLQNKNFFVEQIDIILNEALNTFIEGVLKYAELDQNKIEFINQLINTSTLTVKTMGDKYIDFELPSDYYRHLNSYSKVLECDIELSHYPVQFDDLNSFLNDEYYSPSLEYRETGYYLLGDKIRIYTNGNFNVTEVTLNYVKKHPRLGNPEQSRLGSYILPNGDIAVQQDLILSNRNQQDIITDIAAVIAAIDITDPDYQLKINKLIQKYVSE